MLTTEDLHFSYKNHAVLRGLDLVALDGELVGLVGPNGAGKTTILRLISGALRPTRGVIKIHGTDLAGLKVAERAKLVSVVPQNPQLPLSFSVLELVLMGRNPHLKLLEWESRSDLETARRVMELTDTWHLSDRPIGSISGGERQRAVVALALAQDTPLMLLDEPTSSLDLGHQTGVMDLVRSIQQRRGGTIIVAMHDLTLAAQYCDRLVMLTEGRTYVEGPPADVLTKENISEVYGAKVVMLKHPEFGTPVVLPISNGRGPNGTRKAKTP